MAAQSCKCCKEGKHPIGSTAEGYGYNRLGGDDREWAASHRFARSEHCVRVKGGKQFRGPNWQKVKCGDGLMGFSTRRKGQDDVRMEKGLEGQLKKKRNTLVRPRSARASASRRARRVDGSKVCLVSNCTIMESQYNPIRVAEQKKGDKQARRARNRNNTARRGRRRAMKIAA